LKPLQTLSSRPAGYNERNATADIEVHPSGRFVYIANRGHDSIAAYRVAEDSGKLALVGHTSTEQTPRSFNIEPSGKFLIAAGQGSGKLAVFAVHKDQGVLSRRATYDAGKQPWWVLVVRFDD
jgi:6-phosphogluconolactonase